MFNRHQIENQMLDFAVQRDVAGLTTLLTDLLKQRKKMDVWFDKYLETVEKQMDPAQPNIPVWQLYNRKYEEYQELQAAIKSVNYYREKHTNVPATV